MAAASDVRPLPAGFPGARIPVAPTSVPAGFPSPAQDWFSQEVDLNSHLIQNRVSTFIVRVSGDSMTGAGISDGDELIVDRSLEPRDGSVVVAILDGELTVKRLRITARGVVLQAENRDYPDLVVPELGELEIWGVVTCALHHLR